MTHLLACLATALAMAGTAEAIRLDVPVVRQAPERCGPAALAMVLAYYGADSASLGAADATYDPALRGALVTDLAACAKRLGYPARLAAPGADSLAVLLASGRPPILLVGRGIGPLVRAHYIVVTGWDPARRRYTMNDGGATPRGIGAASLARQWARQGGQALIVSPRTP